MEIEKIVFLVDDDPSILKAFSRLLCSEGFSVEAFSSAGEFLERGCCNGPGCLVLDVNLPDMAGLDLQEEMNKKGITLPIIFITGYGDIPMTVRAMKGGAVNFLTKPVDAGDLLEAIGGALEKQAEQWNELSAIEDLRLRINSLTSRQDQIFRRIIGGMLNKQIAHELGISEKTVKFHRGEAMRKLGVESVAQLARLAEQAGIKPVSGS